MLQDTYLSKCLHLFIKISNQNKSRIKLAHLSNVVLCKIFLISQDKYLLNEPVGIGLIFNGRIKGHTNTRFVHAMNALWAEGLVGNVMQM